MSQLYSFICRFCLSEASNHSFRFEWKFARLSVKDATGKTGVFTHTHTFTHTAWLQILKVACLQTFQLLLLIALLIFSLRFEGSSLKWKCRTRWDLLKVLLISNSSHYGFIKIWVNNGCFLAISRMSDRRALGVQLCERSQKRTCAASKQEMKTYKGRSLFPCLSPWVWIRGGWKCIKPQSRKTKQTKQSKHTHTHLHVSVFPFSPRWKARLLLFHCWITFLTPNHFAPVSLPKYIWGKIAAVFLSKTAKNRVLLQIWGVRVQFQVYL